MKNTITLSTEGCERATAYCMSNKIARRSDGLYVTWLDRAFRIMIARVDPVAGRADMPYALAQGYDNHCAAALVVAPDGRLHAVIGSHCMGFIHRWSDEPADPRSWSLPIGIGMAATYPSLVCDGEGTLHLAYRYAPQNGRWGVQTMHCPRGGGWSWPLLLIQAPADHYIFPSNCLAMGADGVLHLAWNFYKTFPNELAPAHPMAVAHLESPTGWKTWYHTDGREVRCIPVGLEDVTPVKFKGGGDVLLGNIAILPNRQPALVLMDPAPGRIEIAIRGADRQWTFHDISGVLADLRPGWRLGGWDNAQLAVTRDGLLIAVIPFSPQAGAALPREHDLVMAWMDPVTGKILRHAFVPKPASDEPDWLASIEKGAPANPADNPCVLFTGGVGNATANTRVHLMQIP